MSPMNSVTAANSYSLPKIQDQALPSKAGNQSEASVQAVNSSAEQVSTRRPDSEQSEELSKVGILHRALLAAVDTNNSMARLFEPIS